MSLEDRVGRLEDIESIRQLTARYAELNDTGKDPDAMVALFSSDGTWENPIYGSYHGEGAMRSYWMEQAKATDFSLHYMTNHIIDLDESRTQATARWYQFGTFKQGPREHLVGIWYAAECAKTDRGWVFSKMSLARQFLTQFEIGWVKSVDG